MGNMDNEWNNRNYTEQEIIDDYNKNNEYFKYLTNNWIKISNDKYVCPDSITQTNDGERDGVYSIWIKNITNHPNEYEEEFKCAVNYTISRRIYDMSKNEYKVQVVIPYNAEEGKPLKISYLSIFSPWSPINSCYDEIFEYICSKVKKLPEIIVFLEQVTAIIGFICGPILNNLLCILLLIWLIYLKLWSVLIATIISISFTAPLLLSLLFVIPTMIGAFGAKLLYRKYFEVLGIIIMVISSIIIVLIMCIYGISCFDFSMKYINDKNFLCYYLLSYIWSTGPFFIMSSKDETGQASLLTLWFSFAYLMLLIINLFIRIDYVLSIALLMLIMLVPITINLYTGIENKGEKYE